MLTGNTYRKFVSNYVIEDFEKQTTRPAFATVTLVGNDEVIDPIGLPVIFSGTDLFTGKSTFSFYKEDSDIEATAASTLPSGAKVGIVVGEASGFGHNTLDVTVPAGGVPVTIIYREGVVLDNIDFSITQVDGTSDAAPALAAKQAAFKAELEKQGLYVSAISEAVTTSYTV